VHAAAETVLRVMRGRRETKRQWKNRGEKKCKEITRHDGVEIKKAAVAAAVGYGEVRRFLRNGSVWRACVCGRVVYSCRCVRVRVRLCARPKSPTPPGEGAIARRLCSHAMEETNGRARFLHEIRTENNR